MITVTISGPQGAGKTALAHCLHEWLETAGCKVTGVNRAHSKIASQLLTHLATPVHIVEKQEPTK